MGFLPLLFLTEDDGPLAKGFLTGSSVVSESDSDSDIDKGRVSLQCTIIIEDTTSQ